MGLFKKENCCLCDGKTGLLDKKCLSGKVCKECSKKLSVWFDDYKAADSDGLNAQIKQKQADAEKAKTLNFSKIYGEFGVILIDTDARVFVCFADTSDGVFGSPRKVKSIDDVLDLGPDIISFDQVTDFDIDITETSREEKQTVDGSQVSYDPPHITYMESFTLRLTIDHPYIKSVYIPLNSGTVQIRNLGRRQWTDPGRKLAAYLLDLPQLVPEKLAAVYNNDSLIDLFYHSPYEMPAYSYGFKCTIENWSDILKYQYYLAMANEIQNSIKGH